MFTFSWKWLWAQCLCIAAGLFLLGYLTMPGSESLSHVTGRIEHVDTISRKGLGRFYQLTVKSVQGEESQVLIARDVAPEPAMRGLVGQSIAADVNWSSEAITAEMHGGGEAIARKAGQSAIRRKQRYDNIGGIAFAIGIFLGLAGLILNRSRA